MATETTVARVSLVVAAPRHMVWEALTDPRWMTRYMPLSDVTVDWRAGGTIAWRGQLGRKTYDVTGTVQRVEADRHLAYDYVGVIPRLTHRVTIDLSDRGTGTEVTLSEDNHATGRELDHANGAWRLVLNVMKSLLERPDEVE